MPRYFMRDTPLQAMEQLMMSQPGQKPRGGGIRALKQLGIAVIFEKENINSLEEDSEL